MTRIADRLDSPGSTDGAWLILTPKDKLPQPDKVAYPKPPKAADGSLIYERIPNKCDIEKPAVPNATSPVSLKRRHPDDINGVVDSSKYRLLERNMDSEEQKHDDILLQNPHECKIES